MLFETYINEPGNSIYATEEYLNLIRNHREAILSSINPTILNDQEMSFYRHRIHAYLLNKGIKFCYHLPIMALNNIQTEFDFGVATSNILNNNITTIYIPLVETLKDYAKKIQFKSG